LAGIESASGTGAGRSGEFGAQARRPRSDARLQADGSPIRPFSKSHRDFAPRQRLWHMHSHAPPNHYRVQVSGFFSSKSTMLIEINAQAFDEATMQRATGF
jgi:hypothetical protein